MVGTLEEKIEDEFANKSWETDEEHKKQVEEEYKKHAIKLIAKAVCKNDLREIKEIIEELEDEIGQI